VQNILHHMRSSFAYARNFFYSQTQSNCLTPAHLNQPLQSTLSHGDPTPSHAFWIQSAPHSKLRSIVAITFSYYLNRILAIIPLSSWFRR